MKNYIAVVLISSIATVGCSPSIESQCSQIIPIIFTNPPVDRSVGSAVNFYKDQENKIQKITVNDPQLKVIQTKLVTRYQAAAELAGGNLSKVTPKKLQQSFADDLSVMQEFVKVCPPKKKNLLSSD